MKKTESLFTRPALRGVVLALAITALSSYVTRAVPYASQVTKSGNTVTFILNHEAQGMVVLRDGANPVTPSPGPATPGAQTFDMTGFTTYSIIVTGNTAKAWTQYVVDGTERNFEYPFGVAINKNPASTNFGKVYVSNARIGTTVLQRACSDGIYVLRADGVDLGFKDGGRTWTGNSAPLRSTIGPDSHLYVADLANDLAFEFNDDMSAVTQLIDGSNKTAGQWVHCVYVTGTQAAGDRKLYLVNGNYLDARVGLIMYDLGANATATANDVGTQLIGPDYYTFYPYDVARDSSGFWYLNQYRATAGQAPAIDKFDGSVIPNNTPVWSTTSDYTYTWGMDLYEQGGQVAVGTASGTKINIFATSTGAFLESFDANPTASAPRELAYDAAGNMVTVDNAAEWARFWSPGGYTVATTKSDGTFDLFRPAVNVSVTASPDTTSMDTSQPPGVFTVTRSGSTAGPLTVNYTLSGTATNGTHYQTLPTSVTLTAGASSANINVVAIPFTPAGPTRSVVLTLLGSGSYTPYPPSEATVWIVDTNKPTMVIARRDAQFYERTNDFARFTLTRYGDTNIYLGQVNMTYGGTATAGTQFYGDSSVTFNTGEVTKDAYVYPIHDGAVTGPLTVTATVAPAGFGEYNVGTPGTSADAATRVDSDNPPETVLWSDNFNADSSANWTVLFATTNGAALDYCLNAQPDFATIPLMGAWPFDYSQVLIGPAPHSTDGSTLGLYMTVNKQDGALAAAALNLYPKLQNFSGNFALRFDMFLIKNSGAASTEYALFGINHSGTKTNWFRNSTAGHAGVDPTTWSFDGVFYGLESDGAALGDYVGYSSPTTAGINPTPIPAGPANPGRNASSLTAVFKVPPWTAGGVPANTYGTSTPIWADVEIAHVNGVISWYINKELIFAYTNATGYNSGNIMLGYTDAYDSVGSQGGAVIYDNVRVVQLAAPITPANITSIVPVGAPPTSYNINYSGGSGSQFVLVTSLTVNAPLSGWSRIATNSTGSGTFSVTAGTQGFYRIISE